MWCVVYFGMYRHVYFVQNALRVVQKYSILSKIENTWGIEKENVCLTADDFMAISGEGVIDTMYYTHYRISITPFRAQIVRFKKYRHSHEGPVASIQQSKVL